MILSWRETILHELQGTFWILWNGRCGERNLVILVPTDGKTAPGVFSVPFKEESLTTSERFS